MLSADLGISAAVAGQLATVFALTYAIGSPILAVLFSNFDRKTLLLFALISFALANLSAGFSLNLGHLAAARVLMALAAGLFMPTANAVAVAVSAPEHRGRAIATVSSGLTIATALGVPFGTLIGYQVGWRSIFLLIAALSALAVVGLAYGLPRGLPPTTASLGQSLAVAGRGKVLRALLVLCCGRWAGSPCFHTCRPHSHWLVLRPGDQSRSLNPVSTDRPPPISRLPRRTFAAAGFAHRLGRICGCRRSRPDSPSVL